MQRVIGHHNAWPYRVVELLLGREAPRVPYHAAQHRERFGLQLDVLFAEMQAPACQIERKRSNANTLCMNLHG